MALVTTMSVVSRMHFQ